MFVHCLTLCIFDPFQHISFFNVSSEISLPYLWLVILFCPDQRTAPHQLQNLCLVRHRSSRVQLLIASDSSPPPRSDSRSLSPGP
jgi:hypothetical protein